MQRAAGAFIGKKIKDELFSAPKPTDPDDGGDPPRRATAAPERDSLDGQTVEDEDGRSVGTAHRVPGVAVYVAYDGYGDPQAELARCVAEVEPRLLLTSENGRITGLIYVPDPSQAPQRPQALRADDV